MQCHYHVMFAHQLTHIIVLDVAAKKGRNATIDKNLPVLAGQQQHVNKETEQTMTAVDDGK